MSQKIRVLMVQQHSRHYRAPLLIKLSQEEDIDLTMIEGTYDPVDVGEQGLNTAEVDYPFRVIKSKMTSLRYKKDKELLWFGASLKLVKNEDFDVVVCDYFTRLLSIWPMQRIIHKKGKVFMLWGQGFHQYPNIISKYMRMLMVRRSDGLILYSEREKNRYLKLGVPAEKLFVATNTVDLGSIDAAISKTTEEDKKACLEKLKCKNTNSPIIVYVGRLLKNKRLDMLIVLCKKLKRKWPNIKLILIGSGPEKEPLERQVKRYSLENNVYFTGAIIDHNKLAPWMLVSDLVVAPSPVGLQAPMALAYGKPLVLSDYLQNCGPERLVFVSGLTGELYKHLDEEDLLRVVEGLLRDAKKRARYGRNGYLRVHKLMGPEKMLEGFLSGIRTTFRTHIKSTS